MKFSIMRLLTIRRRESRVLMERGKRGQYLTRYRVTGFTCHRDVLAARKGGSMMNHSRTSIIIPIFIYFDYQRAGFEIVSPRPKYSCTLDVEKIYISFLRVKIFCAQLIRLF